MKYLTPEIEALSKDFEVTKSLAKRNVSCGIFQDYGKDSYIINKDNDKNNNKLP
jgi:hypothetical protein|tara:strand:+ start:18582 stop:18743 length:162 start_codon:yes stop_codon:yes gene_type:complete